MKEAGKHGLKIPLRMPKNPPKSNSQLDWLEKFILVSKT